MEKKQIYINKNLKIYYYIQDEKAINDIEKAVWKGQKDIIEYLGLDKDNDDIIIDVYKNIEELHLDIFGEKKEEWEVCFNDNNKKIIKVVSPLNPGNTHDYFAILNIISKSVADMIIEKHFNNIPIWLDITTYVTRLNTEEKTYSKPRIAKFKKKGYFNFSDSYFITRYIAETFGKNIVLKILQNPDKYNEILNMTDEEIDKHLEEYYC